MQALYKEYKDNKKVRFFLVYVREAHPVKKATKSKDHRGITVHKTVASKVLAASKCVKGLKLTLPCLIDSLDGAAEKLYRGRPAATAVVDINGKIVFHARGPRGVQPKKVKGVLEKLLPTQPAPTTQPTTQPTSQPTTRPAATGVPTGNPVRPAGK